MMLPEKERLTAKDVPWEIFLFPYLANGVTLVQDLFSPPEHLVLRERIARGDVLGPRLVLARMIDGPEKAWPPPLGVWVASVLGALMLAARLDAEPEPPCTTEERLVLEHLILAHHGRRECSPVAPLTLEAEVLHWADNASAHTASFTDALREAEPGISSRRFWQLDQRRTFRARSDWGLAEATGPGLSPGAS